MSKKSKSRSRSVSTQTNVLPNVTTNNFGSFRGGKNSSFLFDGNTTRLLDQAGGAALDRLGTGTDLLNRIRDNESGFLASVTNPFRANLKQRLAETATAFNRRGLSGSSFARDTLNREGREGDQGLSELIARTLAKQFGLEGSAINLESGLIDQARDIAGQRIQTLLNSVGVASKGSTVSGSGSSRGKGKSSDPFGTAASFAGGFFSDPRLKENIRFETAIHLTGGRWLGMYSWDWNENYHEVFEDQPNYGFLTTEVKQVFPEHVFTVLGYDAIDYESLMDSIDENLAEIH